MLSVCMCMIRRCQQQGYDSKTHQVQCPDPVVLSDRQGTQAAVKDMACVSQLLLGHQQLQVFYPHTWHLVHGDKCPLICVVETFHSSMVQWQASDCCSTLFQVCMPKLQHSNFG